ncbi:MAG TPA: class I SAM-dependent methyltransferase [Candidatus Binataceae bacterium]|nr:class I SAM-dependent methyltransferase [Candidatus Binataceae bacterium]
MTNDAGRRAGWDGRHGGRPGGGEPEPFVIEVLPLLPRRGVALDVAAGRGRHSLALARAGLSVVAVDYSRKAIAALADAVHGGGAAVWPVVADLDTFPIGDGTLDLIVNVNYLDRSLFPKFARALKPEGFLLADTFLVDQAASGHPRDPRFLLGHYELRTLIGGLEIIRYREGLMVYPDGTSAWRASALVRRKET